MSEQSSRVLRRRKVINRAGVVLGSVALVFGATAASAAPAQDVKHPGWPGKAKPAVLLVHGAFADASSWDGVARRLLRDGYEVTSAAVPLRGLTYDSAYVKSLLKAMPRKTILVGHSYGGAVITNAAAGESNAAGLVYVAAFAPDKDETVGALDAKYGGPATKITVPHEYPLPTGTPPQPGPAIELSIARDKFRQNFAQDVPENDAAVLAAGQRPIATTSFTEASGVPAWKSLPSWYLVSSQDRMIPPAGQREMAKRMKATVVERWASHAVTVSQPGAVADVIESAAARVKP